MFSLLTIAIAQQRGDIDARVAFPPRGADGHEHL